MLGIEGWRRWVADGRRPDLRGGRGRRGRGLQGRGGGRMTGRGLTCTAEKASDHLSFLFMRPPAVKLPPVQLLSPYVSPRYVTQNMQGSQPRIIKLKSWPKNRKPAGEKSSIIKLAVDHQARHIALTCVRQVGLRCIPRVKVASGIWVKVASGQGWDERQEGKKAGGVKKASGPGGHAWLELKRQLSKAWSSRGGGGTWARLGCAGGEGVKVGCAQGEKVGCAQGVEEASGSTRGQGVKHKGVKEASGQSWGEKST